MNRFLAYDALPLLSLTPSAMPPPSSSSSYLRALCLLLLSARSAFAAIAVTAPASPPSSDANVVYSNFLGLSLELSFINYYFGNSTAEIPQPFVKYLSTLHAHGSGQPVRIRLGGNSMDSSTYVPGQSDIIQFTDPNANWNDQPVNFGPQLFDVMKGVSSAVGGAQYLIGRSLSFLGSFEFRLGHGCNVDAHEADFCPRSSPRVESAAAE